MRFWSFRRDKAAAARKCTCFKSPVWLISLCIVQSFKEIRMFRRDVGSLKIINEPVWRWRVPGLNPVSGCNKLNGNHEWVILRPFTTTSIKISLSKTLNHFPSVGSQCLTIDYCGCTTAARALCGRVFVFVCVTKCDTNGNCWHFHLQNVNFVGSKNISLVCSTWPHTCKGFRWDLMRPEISLTG